MPSCSLKIKGSSVASIGASFEVSGITGTRPVGVSVGGSVVADGVAVANRTRVKVVKNKVAAPFQQAEFDIIYGEGISREGGVIDLGVEHGIIKKSGSWYTYNGEQLGQGKERVRQFLKDNPGLTDDLEQQIRDAADPKGDGSAN